MCKKKLFNNRHYSCSLFIAEHCCAGPGDDDDGGDDEGSGCGEGCIYSG